MTTKKPHNIASPENKAKRAIALKEFHANPDKPTNAGVPRVGKAVNTLAQKLDALMDTSLANIKKAIEGDASVSKLQVEVSRWVVTQQIATKKAAQDARLKRLELLAKEKAAKEAGLVSDKTVKEKAEEFGKPRAVNFSMDFEEEIEAEDEDTDEDE